MVWERFGQEEILEQQKYDLGSGFIKNKQEIKRKREKYLEGMRGLGFSFESGDWNCMCGTVPVGFKSLSWAGSKALLFDSNGLKI